MAGQSDDPGAKAAEQEARAALAANERFYEIFADGDATGMDALWSRSEPVLCIHPGTPPLIGRPAVMRSWRELLEAPPPIQVLDARVQLVRGVAFVTCLEEIAGQVLAACNVFVWELGGWRLVHHQAGGVADGQVDLGPPPDASLH